MLVRDLVKELVKYPGTAKVILSKDGEGNGYSPISGLEDVMYVAETNWYGEVYDLNDDEVDGGEYAIVMWPVG